MHIPFVILISWFFYTWPSFSLFCLIHLYIPCFLSREDYTIHKDYTNFILSKFHADLLKVPQILDSGDITPLHELVRSRLSVFRPQKMFPQSCSHSPVCLVGCVCVRVWKQNSSPSTNLPRVSVLTYSIHTIRTITILWWWWSPPLR